MCSDHANDTACDLERRVHRPGSHRVHTVSSMPLPLQDYAAEQCPQQAWGDLQVEWMFKQPATLELTHNWCAAPNL